MKEEGLSHMGRWSLAGCMRQLIIATFRRFVPVVSELTGCSLHERDQPGNVEPLPTSSGSGDTQPSTLRMLETKWAESIAELVF